MSHQLVIKSFYDAQANCSSNDWEFIATGERSEGYIKEVFDNHLKAIKRVKKELCNCGKFAGFHEYSLHSQ